MFIAYGTNTMYAPSSQLAYSLNQTNQPRKTPSVGNTDTVTAQSRATADAAVELDISEDAWNISRKLEVYEGKNGPLQLDPEIFSRDAIEQRKADAAAAMTEQSGLSERELIASLFDSGGGEARVIFAFNEGTLEKFIADKLAGKAANAEYVAYELGQMVTGTRYNSGATVEERAVIRETALKNAEDIARIYFDDPAEAKAFLEELHRFADNDILREKGYIVFDNADIAPRKPYESTLHGEPAGAVKITGEYVKKFCGYSVQELYEDGEKLKAYFEAWMTHHQTWEATIVNDFAANEKTVTAIMDKVKASLNETDVAESLQRLLKFF